MVNSSAHVQRLWNYFTVKRDDSLADGDGLSDPGLIAAEIVEDLEAALEQFRLIADELGITNQELRIKNHSRHSSLRSLSVGRSPTLSSKYSSRFSGGNTGSRRT